jgi:hypothetical protein
LAPVGAFPRGNPKARVDEHAPSFLIATRRKIHTQ